MNRLGGTSKQLMGSTALLLAAFVAGCGGGGGGGGGGGSGSGSSSAGSDSGSVCEGSACVSLGTAGSLGAAAGYAILAKSGVSTVPSSTVTGNVGLSPAARTFLTGWSETLDGTGTFSTSSQVAAPSRLYAADYLAPTPTNLSNAVGSMETAYTAAQAKTSTAACPGSGGSFGGLTLAAGVYTCAVNVTIPTSVTLNGSATDVWVFQITGTLNQSSATQVILTGGALPKNVFWQVSGAVTIGTTATMRGVILAQTNIAVQTGATVIGRLLAQTAVTLDKATVTRP